ncbi:MAG: hypothetical protein ACR2G2_09215 [Pseudonocardia sp.]
MNEHHNPTTTQIGDERAGRGRWVVWLAGLVVVLAAGSATAHGLYVVARGSGNSVPIAWLYPVITDGLALVAYTATTRLHGPARRYAWTVVILAAGLSGLAQATYLAGALPPPGPVDEVARVAAAPAALRFGVGAWPAVAAAIAAHLLFLIGTHRTPTGSVAAHVSTPVGAAPALPVPLGRDTTSSWDGSGCPVPGVPSVPSHDPQTLAGADGGQRFALPVGLDLGRTPGMRRALSQADRARTVAELHNSRTGTLPTVRELAELADVGRGTADRALSALRAQANGLHVVTDPTDERPKQ